MSGLNEMRARPGQRYAYRGLSLLVMDLGGAVSGDGSQGFYYRNTRHLSRMDIAVDGRPLESFSAAPVSSDRFLAYAAVELPEARTNASGLPEVGLYAEIDHRITDGLRVEVRLRLYHPTESRRVTLGVRLDADFADVEIAERSKTTREVAPTTSAWDGIANELVFRCGDQELDLATGVRVIEAPGPVRWADGNLETEASLEPGGVARLVLEVEPIVGGVRRPATLPAAESRPEVVPRHEGARARLAGQAIADELPRLITTNATVARAWATAVQDLASLPLGLEPGPASPMAGLPLYQQLFGRDTLTIAWQALAATRVLARDALRLNAAWQGHIVDDWRDEEPGKMLHQARWGPQSRLGKDPFDRYYGDYATVPDFLVVLGQYLSWSGDVETVRAMLPAARNGIAWLERYADLDGDGFVEYVTRSEGGVKNQGWLDSGDAIVDEHGAIVENPIATSELQGYVFAGLGQAALAFGTLGDAGMAADLIGRAQSLRARFHDAFWMADQLTYASALGPDKRQVRSVASNAGHLLAAGIVPPEFARTLADRLMKPDMFSGWGVRTLSSDHAAYDPFSYHRGSVWPVEQATIAFGFARYACWPQLHRLARGVFDASDLFVANRLPEVLGGLPRDEEHGHPGIYPKSHQPQGWSASAIVLLVQSLLGMRAFAPLRLLLVDPHLPDWLPDLKLEGMRLGEAVFDLEARREGNGRTAVRLTNRRGTVILTRQPVPDPGGSPQARIGAALHRTLPFVG